MSVLDIGCGCGILSMVSLLLGAKIATAVDIDQNAVQMSIKNAKLNNVADRFTAKVSNLTEAINGTYDIIVANILADPIKELLKDLPNYIHSDTTIILSGIVDFRTEEVEQIIKENFNIFEKQIKNNWVCYVLKPKQLLF